MSPLGTFAYEPCQKSVKQHPVKRQQTTDKMKLYTFLLSVAVAAIAVGQVAAKFDIRTHDDAVKAHEECREANNVPDEIYEKFLNYEFPQHRRTNCYVKCFVEKMGLFTERNGYNENAVIAQFTSNNYKDLEPVRHGLEKCIDHNEAESDVCTWANRIFSCWLPINRHVVRKIYG